MRMSNQVAGKEDAKSALMPKLRFPEFLDAPEWENKPIGGEGDLLSGYPFDGSDISQDSTGARLLRGINITEGYVRHNSDIDRYFLKSADELQKFTVQSNDLVIAMDGSKVGKNSALITAEDSGAILVQRVARLRSNNAVTISFIFQRINSPTFHAYVDRINTSSGIPHISAKQIREFTIGFPSETEQQKIAECLTMLDEVIAAQSQKLDALKTHKKGLMQQLFPREGETLPRLRFPEFRGAPEWVEKNLEAVCAIQRGKFSHRPRNDPRFFGGRYPFIQTGDVVKSNGGSVQASQTLNEQGLSVSKLFKPPIVLITIAANIGDTGLLDREACFTDSVAGLIPKRGVSAVFLELAVRGKKAYLNKIAPAAAQKNINNEILSVLPISIPEFEEQQRIASCLTSLDDLITAQNTKLESLKTHKQALMQQLFPSPDTVEA